ncbi:MAG: SCO family protein [Xanthobacteraceae bacterium]|jgi:cytochrome oxidase Cu insertion factor (SCO1/SenC/PrrC family)
MSARLSRDMWLRRGAGRPIPLCLAALLAWVAAATLLLGGGMTVAADAGEPSAEELVQALLSGKAPVGGPFDLVDHTGQRRTDADFRGKLVLIYFGFTRCPDACPTELLAISLALDKLGRAADAVQPLFITVDPERDMPAVLADYVASFHPRLVGLTGEPASIKTLAHAYKTFFARSAGGSAGNYSIDHTGFIYVVGPEGRYRGFLPPQLAPEQIADAIRPHLATE